ncbi:MAG: hypothetical protein LRY73_05145 [Bacillus sp. (in: Bacteria)]|nr:hypothetical protein [Bacillus sp. (in: firmicutes)]
MITIALDESGSFENRSAINLVGGLIFKGDYETEKQEIESFFERECNELGLQYPKDIHAVDSSYRTEIQQKGNILKGKVKEYIQENGNYQFLFILRSRNEREDYKNISNLVNDKVASNLYEHMVTQLLVNCLFYNTYHQGEKDIVLELATRTVPVSNSDTDTIHMYKQLGYRFNEGGSRHWFYLIDKSTFKNALALKMMDSRIKREIDVTQYISSINYHKQLKDEARPTTPFLYLADLACDIIRETIDPKVDDFGVEQFSHKAQQLTGNELLFWAYADIDQLWNDLYSSFEEKDFISFLEIAYELRKNASDFRDYYEKNWLSKLENQLMKIFNPDKIGIYVNQLRFHLAKERQAISKQSPSVTKAIYIGNTLQSTISEWERTNGKFVIQKDKYQIADMMLGAYNHRGDITNAQLQFETCKLLRNHVPPQDFFGTKLNVAQMHANSFDFQGALDSLERSERFLELYKEITKDIAEEMGYGDSELGNPLLGKIRSSFGQFYSFMRKKEEALTYFTKALKEFEKGSLDEKITVSYLLHMALDSRDRELYDTYVETYLGSKDVVEQFELIFNREYKDSYQLFLYVKSLNVFYQEEGKLLRKQLTKNVKEILQLNKFDGHPWELIYKHVAIWLYHFYGNSSWVYECIDRMNRIITNPVQEVTVK